MENDLKDKSVIVTGGTSGIGKAIAQRFAVKGARVTLFGSNLERGTSALEEIKQSSGSDSVIFFQVDVSNMQEVQNAIQTVIEHFGEIDILINNAGIVRDNLLMKMPEDDWDRVLAVNLKSVYNTCKSIIRHLIKARKGKIINISSVIGLTGNAGQVNYAASKSGMIGFTKSLAKELASRNVCVNCIAPGFIDTNMTEGLTDKLRSQILNGIPLGRMGLPEEVAYTAEFLAGKQSNYITGQVIILDGGMTI